MSLLAEMEKLAGGTPLWLIPGKGVVTLDRLRLFLARHSSPLQTLAGKRVALTSANQAFLAALLVGLDGVCEQLLTVPDGSDSRTAELLAAYQPQAVLAYVDGALSIGGEAAAVVPLEMELLWEGEAGDSSAVAAGVQDTCWVIPTSGTTGPPKLVKHRLKSLTRSVKARPSGVEDFRWGLLYSLARFAGLQVFFQALLNGSLLVLCEQMSPLDQQLSQLAGAGCTALSATPTMWRKILMTPAAEGLSLRQITLGGEIADQQILSALRQRFPKARIIHIYASTEAGVGFVVTDGLAGFPADYLTTPPDSTAIAVNDTGRLMLRPTNLLQEYVGGAPVFDRDGWVDTGDRVMRAGERYCFLGRDNGCINVGGNKVHPEEVEQVLRTFAGLLDATVRGQKNPFTGFLVAADIVLDEGVAATRELEKAILAHCRQRLEPFKVPALLRFVPAFSLTDTGKIERG